MRSKLQKLFAGIGAAGCLFIFGICVRAEKTETPAEPGKPEAWLTAKQVSMDRQPNENGWIREDTTFTVMLPSVEGEGGAELWAEYRKQGEEAFLPMEQDGGNPQRFLFTETDAVYEGAYEFRAVLRKEGDGSKEEEGDISKGEEGDVPENGEEESSREEGLVSVEFRKDKTEPSADTVRVLYGTDRSFSREEQEAALESERFLGEEGLAEGAFGAVVAKEKIELVLYIQDEISGVESVDYCFEDGEGERRKGTAFAADDLEAWIDGERYAAVVLALSGRTGEEWEAGRLNITGITDRAGNKAKAVTELTPLRSGRVLVTDSKAPRLLACAGAGTAVLWVNTEDGEIPLYQNAEGADVRVSFSVEDWERYWRPENVSVEFMKKTGDGWETVQRISGGELVWTEEGERHASVCGFDGEAEEEGIYRVLISYADAAGNLMEEACERVLFALDHAAPSFSVSYTEPNRSLHGVAYYKEDVSAVIRIRERYAALRPGAESESFGGLEDLQVIRKRTYLQQEKEVTAETDITSEIVWNKTQGPVYEGRFTLKKEEEGTYSITVSYRDAAGNRMVSEEGRQEEQPGTLEEGIYRSADLVLDITPPAIFLAYDRAPFALKKGIKYFNKAVTLALTVEDRNFRVKELQEALLGLRQLDSEGEEVPGEQGKQTPEQEKIAELDGELLIRDRRTLEIMLSAEANYWIPLDCTDLAGNRLVWAKGQERQGEVGAYREGLVIDGTAPEELQIVCTAGGEPDCTAGGWMFSKKPFLLTAKAKDRTAGLRMLSFVVLDEEGKETKKEAEILPPLSAQGEYRIELPLEGADFKGSVRAQAVDWCGNRSEWIRNCLVESDEKHKDAGKVSVTAKTQPGRIVNGVAFYNTDIELEFFAADLYSGLRSVRYTGGTTLSGSYDFAPGPEAAGKTGTQETSGDQEASGTQETTGSQEAPGKDGLTYHFSKRLTLRASENNENGVPVKLEYTDHAGHTGQAQQRYHVDVTKPEITVEYDEGRPAHGKYYRQTRTAAITIRERNFDSSDVKFHITNTDQAMPVIGEWSSSGSGDDMLHRCYVSFEEDGDYTFTLSFQDKAGNQADYSRTDTFTIDKTPPKLEVLWDSQTPGKERYYAKSRTAVIRVTEHNFDPLLLEVLATAQGDAQGVPSLSGWSRNGDLNTARINFAQDGAYTLSVKGEDLAGNGLLEYEEERFVIDLTPPKLSLFGVEDGSANRKEVRPGIRVLDTNYDAKGLSFALEGRRLGRVERPYTKTENSSGAEYRLSDLEWKPELDDLYIFSVSACDLAGNKSEKEIAFSVNRFGSVYTFQGKTESLAGENGSYYTKEAIDIVVTETNVDTLEFLEITCSRNGVPRTMKEGTDYSVGCSETKDGWKQYTYTVGKQNFQEEGLYLLTIYSEDRADNASDTGTKGKKIAFAVDKTPPSIVMSGIEDRGRYREAERSLTLDVQDNLRLSRVEVTLNGKATVYDAAGLAEADGILHIRAEAANHWQELSVQAVDAAGNRQELGVIRFLVTPSGWIQFFLNKKAFYGTLAGIGMFELCLAMAVRRRMKRRAEIQ